MHGHLMYLYVGFKKGSQLGFENWKRMFVIANNHQRQIKMAKKKTIH